MKKNILMSNPDVHQSMTYDEWEALKRFSCCCEREGDAESLARLLTMIAHWFRQGERIPFTEFATQWIEAQKGIGKFGASTKRMQEAWPFLGRRRIAKGYAYYLQKQEG